jgi:hypothetical protein
MTKIKYIVGDLFAAIAENPNPIIIPHICNDIGAWGAGFVVPLGKHFPKAKEMYLDWASKHWKLTGIPFKLGEAQYVHIDDQITVMNMIGQRDCGHDDTGRPPIRYSSLVRCMQNVAAIAEGLNAEIHAPAFGAGLAGGDWEFLEEFIIEIWCDWDIPVTIYSLEEIPRKSEIVGPYAAGAGDEGVSIDMFDADHPIK